MRPPTGRHVSVLLTHPADHVRAPLVFNEWCARTGVDLLTVALDVSPDRLETVLDGLRSWRNLVGGIVTMPHKQAMATLVDDQHVTTTASGSVNAFRRRDGRFEGATFDGRAFVDALVRAGHGVAGRRVVVVGPGGTGRAVAAAVLERGGAVTLVSRTASRARAARERLLQAYPHASVDLDARWHSADIVVNATPLGMQPEDPLPLDVGALGPGAVVADVVHTPAMTGLLTAAESRGLVVHDGRKMLAEQVAHALDFFGFDATLQPTTP